MPASPLSPHLASPVELKERIEAERSGRPFLVYRDDNGHQEILPLIPGEPAMIGREPECDACIHWDPRVSSLHAELRELRGHWIVIDEGLSRNGTYLNGERVGGRRRLRDGDQLEVGETMVVFCEPTRRQARSTASGKQDAPPELSPAQLRVLVALCRPFRDGTLFATPATNQQIAAELYLTVAAVKSHLRSLFHRFGIAELPQNEKRAALAKSAFEQGVVRPSDIDSAR